MAERLQKLPSREGKTDLARTARVSRNGRNQAQTWDEYFADPDLAQPDEFEVPQDLPIQERFSL